MEHVSTREIISVDSNGYKYKINLHNLLNGKTPSKYMRNPFALSNFKLYLKLHYPNYELLDGEYINCKTKMRFICNAHPEKGIQYNTVDNIVNNHHACLYCGCSEVWEKKRTPVELMQKECDRVGVRFVERTSKNNECWVNYICPKHEEVGVQSSSWTHFKEFTDGCPHCNKISSGEKIILNILTNNDIHFIREHKFPDCMNRRRLRFDFYIPTINTVIEYNGIQHYQPVTIFGGEDSFIETSKRDKLKNDYCNDNNIRMVVIPYWEQENIGEILSPIISEAHSKYGEA